MSKLKLTWYNRKQEAPFTWNGDFALKHYNNCQTEQEALFKKLASILESDKKASLALTNEAFATPVVIIAGKLITSPSWALQDLAQLIVNHENLAIQVQQLS
ncbi:MAG: hypothetical protein LCH37_15240 [Bacteroidetes bacterium]|nr:hypothetical protein [Bacteroidota bacterium]